MKITLPAATPLFTGLILASTCWTSAQDWPQWRGPNRDAKIGGFTAPATWPAELSQQWKVVVGDGVATPALVGDRLYVFARQGGSEVTLCLDAKSGKEIWRDQYDSLGATGPASRFSGPRSSPAVAGGKLVTFGVRGVLSALDAATGKVLWRKNDYGDSPPRFFTSASPILVGDVCVAQLGGEEKGAIAAYDLATGDQKWKWDGDGTAYASPALVTVDGVKYIVTLTANQVTGVRASDGQLAWQTPFAPQRRAYNAATPIVSGQTVIYTGSGRGTMAVKLAKDGDKLVAQELWSNPDAAVQFNTPVLKDNLLFGLSEGGDFFGLDSQTGKTLWTKSTGERGGYGSIVDAGSVLFALTPQSRLVVLSPSGNEYSELAGYAVADTPTHAYPVVAGRNIYIKAQDSLALWTLP